MAIQLTQDTVVIGQAAFSSNATQMHRLGQAAVDNRGGRYRYGLAGGTTLVAGKLQQSAAEVTANQNLTAVAAAVGDVTIASTSTITVTANQYAEGWAVITVTPGVGYMYPISGHAAFTAAAPSFTISEPIQVALTTTSRIDIVQNPYYNLIVLPTTATSAAVGAAIYPVTNAQYGWIKDGGPASLLADAAITVGVNVSASNAIAGAVEAAVTAQGAVGIAMTGIADTEYGAVLLTLD